MDPMPPTPPMQDSFPSDGGLPPPALEDGPQMDSSRAFGVGRALGNGVSALRRAPGPMFLAGLLMVIFDGGYGGNGGGSGNDFGGRRDYDDDYGGYNDDYGSYNFDDDYADFVDAVGQPVHAAVTDVFGDVLEPAAEWLQLGGAELGAMLAAMMVVLVCVFIMALVFWLARAFLKPGVIRLHSHVLQTADPQNFKVLFSGSDRFVHMLLWDLLAMFITFSVALVTALPGGSLIAAGAATETDWMLGVGALLLVLFMLPALIYVGFGLAFGPHLVVLENRSPIEALKRSWALARGNRLSVFIYAFVAALVGIGAFILGLLLCCVGLIFTLPCARAVTDFGFTESFLMLTRGEGVTGYWELWNLKHSGQIP